MAKKDNVVDMPIAGKGHNNPPMAGNVAEDQLKSYLERVERLMDEKANIASDIADIYREAKGNGFDVKTMKEMVKLRAMTEAEREEREHLRDTYARALGFTSWQSMAESELD